MSRPSRDSRICAAPCWRLELAEVRWARAVWCLWLCALAAATGFAVDASTVVRGLVCLLLIGSLPPAVGLAGQGDGSVHSLEWREPAQFILRRSPRLDLALPVTGIRVRRFGNLLWVLRIQTSEGTYQRLCRPQAQDPEVLRRFVRALPAGGSGQFGPPAGRS